MKKVAIFIDWDNLRNAIAKIQHIHSIRDFDFNNIQHLKLLIHKFINVDEEIYRIYFYTAAPLNKEKIESQLSGGELKKFQKYYSKLKNKQYFDKKYQLQNDLIENIVKIDNMALREGKLQVRGTTNTGYPDMVQKQVDMLLGLDISHVAYMKLADKVLIFSKDTDIVPALKIARINGLQAILSNFTELNNISHSLIKHTDIIRELNFKDINREVRTNAAIVSNS